MGGSKVETCHWNAFGVCAPTGRTLRVVRKNVCFATYPNEIRYIGISNKEAEEPSTGTFTLGGKAVYI